MEFDANEQALRESGRYALDQAESHAAGLVNWLMGARERAHDATHRRAVDARNTAGTYIHRYPFGAVAVAFAVGVATGVLLTRR